MYKQDGKLLSCSLTRSTYLFFIFVFVPVLLVTLSIKLLVIVRIGNKHLKCCHGNSKQSCIIVQKILKPFLLNLHEVRGTLNMIRKAALRLILTSYWHSIVVFARHTVLRSIVHNSFARLVVCKFRDGYQKILQFCFDEIWRFYIKAATFICLKC